ncbi:hypothetical protein BH10PAT1_BH10PAT1_0090 [soil metagenome]
MERVRFNPSNPNANIHGMVQTDGNPTCLTRDGETRCTGCCYALHIVIRNKIMKEAGEMCDAQIPTKGCAHVVNSEEEKRYNPVCDHFHCSGQIKLFGENPENIAVRQRLAMMNIASNAVGEITAEIMEENLKRLGL